MNKKINCHLNILMFQSIDITPQTQINLKMEDSFKNIMKKIIISKIPSCILI